MGVCRCGPNEGVDCTGNGWGESVGGGYGEPGEGANERMKPSVISVFDSTN